MLPSLYISHGSPMIAINNSKTSNFLRELPKSFDKPKYILVISAHWLTKELRILTNEDPFIIYDFYNFPQKLYDEYYEVKNDISKVNEIIELLQKNSIEVSTHETRSGYDHGVWIPLKLMYPNDTISIIQLSLPMSYSETDLIKLGSILSELREDTLIIGSGALTHNLRLMKYDEDAPVEKYAKDFRDWIVKNVEKGDTQKLLEYKKEAPYTQMNHPTLEHFLPIFVALGASKNSIGKSLNNIYMHGNQSMDTIIFKD